MSARNDGGPAFPVVGVFAGEVGVRAPEDGMSLRDYFTAAALTGLLQRGAITDMDLLAEKALRIADFVLVEREKVMR